MIDEMDYIFNNNQKYINTYIIIKNSLKNINYYLFLNNLQDFYIFIDIFSI